MTSNENPQLPKRRVNLYGPDAQGNQFGQQRIKSKFYIEGVNNVPVKELRWYQRHSKLVQGTCIVTGLLIFFSKPIYDLYSHYFIAPRPKPKDFAKRHPGFGLE